MSIGDLRAHDQPETGSYSRLQRLSLRWRLVALLAVLLLASSLVVGIVTTAALNLFLTQRLDEQVVAAADRYAAGLEPEQDEDDQRLFSSAAGQPAGTFGARIRAGRVIAVGVVTGENRELRPSVADEATIAGQRPGAGPHTVRLPSLGGEYRVLARTRGDGDVLVTGMPEGAIDETIARLVVIEALVFGGALVLAGALAAIGVRVALRPLTRVAATARRVAGLALSSGEVALSERVPQAPPSTEVGRVAEAFNLMLNHVEASLTARQASEDRLRTFVADASHELRTPVTVIRSHTEYIRSLPFQLPDEVDRALRRVSAEAERSGRLVDDLLLLARLDSGRRLLENDVDLTRLVMDAVNDAHRVDPDRRWQMDLAETPVVVRGDEHRLHQAVANLLANASAHTPAGTTVVTTVSGALLPDQRGDLSVVTITVADDGPGIPEALLPRVFDRFAQGQYFGGPESGLGLSIVKAIAIAHGGSVSVRSRPGETRFALTLPLHAADPS